MRNARSQRAGVFLGVFLLLLSLLCIAYFILVACVNTFGREPQPGKAILAVLLAVFAVVGAVASLRLAGIIGHNRSKATDRNSK